MIISDDKLKELLIGKNIISPKGLDEIIDYSKNSNIPLWQALTEKDVVSDQKLAVLIADYLKIPYIDLSKVPIPEETARVIPEKVARKLRAIPFMRDDKQLKLAMYDPSNHEFQQLLSKKVGLPVIPYLATERDIFNSLHFFRKNLQKTFDEMLRDEIAKSNSLVNNDAPIAKIVDLLISSAYEDNASDIHIETNETSSLARFRIDGILHDVLYIPKNLHDRIITRIKVLSKLRTDEHLAPQDGKIRMKIDEDFLDLRVSILPIVEGEKVVLRLLPSHVKQISLMDLGMNERDLKKVNRAISRSFGMILSTGPTGSGKTTSIYAILKILNTREKNITTIEDPVEYRIKGLNQIQVNTKTNLTFANGLRSILRQDPNIVFVGEIRDSETAGIAVNAALTGHLVLSTLHTNDAATALPRLTDMKVEPFLVASTVNLIVAQRLVRKICDMCRHAQTITKDELGQQIPREVIDRNFGRETYLQVYKGIGCKQCHYTGYSGRLGIFEVLEVTKNIKKLIAQKNDSDVIYREAVAEGMASMLDDGLQKVAKGITTIEEVLRVTKVESL